MLCLFLRGPREPSPRTLGHQAAPFLERDAYLYSGDPEVKLEMIHVCYEKLGIMHPPAPCCGSDRTTRKMCNIDTSDRVMKVTKARRH